MLNLEKWIFGVRVVIFLGFYLTKRGMKVNIYKYEEVIIKEAPTMKKPPKSLEATEEYKSRKKRQMTWSNIIAWIQGRTDGKLQEVKCLNKKVKESFVVRGHSYIRRWKWKNLCPKMKDFKQHYHYFPKDLNPYEGITSWNISLTRLTFNVNVPKGI